MRFLLLNLLRPIFWLIYLLRGGETGFKERQQRAFQPTGRDEKLEQEIRSELSFLFEEHAAEVISNEFYYYSFGNAIIKIACEYLLMIFTRDRGDLRLWIAPRDQPQSMVLVEQVLWGLKLLPETRSWVDLRDLAELLRKFLPAIQAAYSPSQYETTRWRIDPPY
jgi:hypothetical protein